MRFALAIVVVLLGLASAQAESIYEFPTLGPPSGTLRLEGSGDIESMEPLIRGFQREAPDIAITYIDRLTNELYAELERQCAGERSEADLVFSSSVDHIVKLANDGCARAYVSPETRKLPSQAVWNDEVFGFTFEPAVIVYNRQLVPPEDVPRSRDELADLLRRKPANYTGKVGTYDIARSGIGYLFAFFDAQQSSAFGRLIEGLGRARAQLYCCSGELLDDVIAGRILIGYNLLGSYAYGRYEAGAPIGIVLPRDYTLVLHRAAFIPKRASNVRTAERFLDYLISPRGQQIAAAEAFHFAFGAPMPDDVDGPDPDRQSGVYRPIVLGPSLLAVTDTQRRSRLLAEWADAFPP